VNINFKDMSELEVPVPPSDAQEALVHEYYTGLNLYKETIKAAEEGWRGVQEDIQSKLY
jgi:restriction endonuclease S subunit